MWSTVNKLLFRVGYWPTHKHKAKLERLAKGKHFSLLRKFVNCGLKTCYRIGLADPSVKCEAENERKKNFFSSLGRERKRERLGMCMCVCVSEREGEKER